MADDKPPFDSSQPFQAVDKPAFDPSQPFAAVSDTPPSVGADIAKSAGIGLAKGALGLAGISGDARTLGSNLVSKGAGALGYDLSPDTVGSALKFVPGLGGPTSSQLTSATENLTGPLYQPKTTAGEYAQTAGEFAPALIGGPESLASKALTRVAIPALTSETAGQIAHQVAPATEPYVRAATALVGGIGASKIGDAVSAAVTPQANVSADLARALERDGDTPQALIARLQQAQTIRPAAIVADVGGENVRGLVERVAQTPGAGRTQVVPALTSRQQQQMGRISDDLSTLTGNRRNAMDALNDTMAERKANAAPLYDIAMDFNARQSPDIMQAWQNATNSGWGKQILNSSDFKNTLQTEYGISDATNAPMMKVIDAWKKNVDDMTSAALRNGNNNQARVLGNMRDNVISAVDKENAAYPAARDAWAGPSKYMDAINDGGGILDRKLGSDQLAAQWAKMTNAEQEAYRIGAVSAIRRTMGNDPAKLADMTKYLRSPEMVEKISTIMPTPQAAQSWQQRLAYEVGSSELTGRALGNSATARRLAEQQDANGIVGDLVMGALSHGVTAGSLWTKAATYLPQKVRDTLRSKADAMLAGVLTTPQSPATVSRLMQQGGIRTASGSAGSAGPATYISPAIRAASRAVPALAPPALALQGPGTAYGGDDQQQVPRPPGQQKNGGKVAEENKFATGGTVENDRNRSFLGSVESKHSYPSKPKSTKAQVHYRGGTVKTKCSLCEMFESPNVCSAVRGRISPHGLCDLYRAKD